MSFMKYRKVYEWLIQGLIGLIFSVICFSIILTGEFSLTDPFYNCGEVYEIREDVYKAFVVQDKGYQENSGKITLEQGGYTYNLPLESSTAKWKYLCITLDDINNSSLEVTVFYRKQIDNMIEQEYTTEAKMEEGVNLLDIPDEEFNIVFIEFTGENGTSFSVEKIELREKEPYSDFYSTFALLPLIFLGYMIISTLILRFIKRTGKKWNVYSWIEVLQGVYILFARQFEFMSNILSEPKRRYIRRLGFLCMFLYSVFVEITGIYYDKLKYHLAVYGILLLIITIVSLESTITKKNWNHPLVWGWFAFGLMMCVSDFLIPKELRYWGYVLLLVIGFYNFVWNQMRDPSELLWDFVWAVHVFLGIIVLFCLLFRPELETVRYSGISKNSSVFALYLGPIAAVVLGCLDHEIRFRRRWKYMLGLVIEGCVVLTLLWKSQSAGPLLWIAGLSFIWIFRIFRYLRSLHKRRVLAAIMLALVLCIVPVYGGITWGLQNIPQMVGNELIFKGETPVAKTSYGMVVQAADIGERLKSTRLGQKFSSASVSGILSGRNYYYKTYLRNMNLVGHKDRPVMWGHRRQPHNAVLGIAYNYGVFTAVPYLIMLIAVVERTFRYSRRKGQLASVPFYVCTFSILASMADNVEQPFVWLPWMGLYLLMGIVFKEE